MTKEKKFYKDGLRFSCQGCGKCCISRGNHGYVYLSFKDRKRLAVHLKTTTSGFTARYTSKVHGLYELKDTGVGCPFLVSMRCQVYAARPWQCRTWPFWPENMDEQVWEREVLSCCPGAGKGRLYSAEEIEDILLKKKDVNSD